MPVSRLCFFVLFFCLFVLFCFILFCFLFYFVFVLTFEAFIFETDSKLSICLMLVLDRLCFGLYHISVVGIYFCCFLVYFSCSQMLQWFSRISIVFLGYINCLRVFQLLFSNTLVVPGYFNCFSPVY